MSSIRPWAVWRRAVYASVVLLVLGVSGTGWYFLYSFSPANCFDSVRNGSESGVDCGGACVRICAAEVVPPRVVWVNSFRITDGQYNTVAYIENQNQLAATTEFKYTLELLNGNRVVAERSGSTILPPNSIYPIFVGRIFTDNAETITETRISITEPEIWQPATVGRDQFKTLDINLESADSRPRLTVEIENTALTDATNVEVVATIFNDAGEPVTASQTYIERIAARTSQDIVFTWPNSIAKTVRSCVVPTDVALVVDLSGSMNNDSANPPQPLTGAVQAASTFARTLNTKDKIALVTFASDALLRTPLTSEHNLVADSIATLTIDAVEETGFTNTIAALTTAATELSSTNHNEDARRVLVLLTDGLPTAPGEAETILETEAVAEQIDLSGVEIYAIGLGESVDMNFIRNVASEPQMAFFAPSVTDLEDIYRNITSALCESGATRIDVIAKTETNFTPLR